MKRRMHCAEPQAKQRGFEQSVVNKEHTLIFCETLHQQWVFELLTKFPHKITGINNPKEKMKWNKSFIIAMPPNQNEILSIKIKWIWS